jgi:transposase
MIAGWEVVRMDARYAGVPDELWEAVKGDLPRAKRKPKGGRPRVDDRRIFSGIVYRLRTGCQWRALPREFGSGATCHRRFTEWVRRGTFAKLWETLLLYYDLRKGIDWKWTSLDSVIVKAPKGGLIRARTRRTAPRAGRRGTS